MTTETKKSPELLAPASDYSTALNALHHGADAVYAGLQKFNARERSPNFTVPLLSRLVQYAEDMDKKVYLAFNTLLKDNELKEAVDCLADIARIRPHAVLVQDLGVLHLLRTQFPDIPVHASTQMCTHNSAGAEILASLGVERVILERQLTLKELRTIVDKNPVETEVFVHGALCCGLSGRCLFSSWMGGMSGNRGKCKQPCRRRYHQPDGNGFFFSTKDLYTLDLIPRLMDLGIASFKIEGRLKKADYTGRVVKAYKLMIESTENDRKETLSEARRILSGAIGREWSHGFYHTGEKIIRHDAIGVSGLRCGKVTKVLQDGFICHCTQPLRIGDKIRIQPRSGEQGPRMPINRMFRQKQQIKHAKPGMDVFIESQEDIPEQCTVYKTGMQEPGRKETAEDTPEEQIIRPDINVQINSHGVVCHVSTPLTSQTWTWNCDREIEQAKKQALSAEKVRDEFTKSLNPQVNPHNVQVNIENGLFLPFKVLRQIRREFWTWATELLTEKQVMELKDQKVQDIITNLLNITADTNSQPENIETTVLYSTQPKKNNAKKKSHTVVACDIQHADPERCQEVILPDFCPETELSELENKIADVYNKGIRRFRVTALYGMRLLQNYKDITISASFPLPVSNRLALYQIKKLGAVKSTAWIELDQDGLNSLINNAPEDVELYTFGRPPVLSTRADIPAEGWINDARGNSFYIEKENVLTHLYPAFPFRMSANRNTHQLIDLRAAYPDESETSDFNLSRAWT